MHENMTDEVVQKRPLGLLIGVGFVVISLGIGLGFLLARTSRKVATPAVVQSESAAVVNTDKEKGSTNSKVFRDLATGTLEVGGLSGEGTHKLTRDGGPSQTVYMISSVVDLDEYAGKKVEVWGQTIKATKVPWLMDVGRVKLLE